ATTPEASNRRPWYPKRRRRPTEGARECRATTGRRNRRRNGGIASGPWNRSRRSSVHSKPCRNGVALHTSAPPAADLEQCARPVWRQGQRFGGPWLFDEEPRLRVTNVHEVNPIGARIVPARSRRICIVEVESADGHRGLLAVRPRRTGLFYRCLCAG